MNCKNVFDVLKVHRLYKATFSVALATEYDLDTHNRWLMAGRTVLSRYAAEMRLKGLQLDWKVYWNLLQRRFSQVRVVCVDANLALTSFVEIQGHCRKVWLSTQECLL